MANIYWNNEQKCRKLTDFMKYYTPFQLVTFVSSFIHSIYSICIGNVDTSTWILPFYLVVPFSIKTLSGWYFMFFIQVNISVTYAMCVVSVTSYFVSSCFYICTICEHFERLLDLTSVDIKRTDNSRKPKTSKKSLDESIEAFNHSIDLHIKIFE